MPRTKYQRDPGSIGHPQYKPNPMATIQVVGAGSASHPKAFPIGKRRPISNTPRIVNAPGASGTI